MPFFLITVSTHFNKHGSVIKSNNWRRLLGFSTNIGFTFEEHINTLCWKEQKLYDLSRVSQYHNTKADLIQRHSLTSVVYSGCAKKEV